MRKFSFFVLLLTISFSRSQEPLTPFEKDKLTSTTYDECISFYKQLDENSEYVKMFESGETDIGRPLHTVIISRDKYFTPDKAHKNGKVVLLINNGIHPGEPDGIDACMMCARYIINNMMILKMLLKEDFSKNVVIVIIPIYNVDGSLNR